MAAVNILYHRKILQSFARIGRILMGMGRYSGRRADNQLRTGDVQQVQVWTEEAVVLLADLGRDIIAASL
jgi:predicted regulator of Ras-like GTPase activity (Roadblock/LC7/MglB family)